MASQAAQEGARLPVAHCVERMFGGKLTGENLALDEAEVAEALLARAGEIERDHGLTPTLHTPRVRTGRVADELGGLVVGSVTQRLLQLAGRPVLVVPPDERGRHLVSASATRAPEPVS